MEFMFMAENRCRHEGITGEYFGVWCRKQQADVFKSIRCGAGGCGF